MKVAGIGPGRKGTRRGKPIGRGGFSRPFLNAGSRPTVRERNGASTKLDFFNDHQETRFLHPTKGYRTVNPKRSLAQAIMAEIFAGKSMPTHKVARMFEGIR